VARNFQVCVIQNSVVVHLICNCNHCSSFVLLLVFSVSTSDLVIMRMEGIYSLKLDCSEIVREWSE